MPDRPILRYHGGKWRLAPRIIAEMPPHQTYVEPYGGGAGVLLRKPRSYAEVYNDLDETIVTLFRVLRDDKKATELARRVSLTPFSRREFEEAYEPISDDVESARRTLIRSHMGFAGGGASGRPTGFRASCTRSATTPAHDWSHLPSVIADVARRMESVVIECRSAIDVMTHQDSPNTLHYVDPPYVLGSRSSTSVYKHEMADADHEQLADTLHGLEGVVLLSGYRSDLYQDLYQDWRCITWSTIGASNTGSVSRTECLWANPAASSTAATPLFA